MEINTLFLNICAVSKFIRKDYKFRAILSIYKKIKNDGVRQEKNQRQFYFGEQRTKSSN